MDALLKLVYLYALSGAVLLLCAFSPCAIKATLSVLAAAFSGAVMAQQ